MTWLELCTTYSSSSPVVTTTSIILCSNKRRLNPGSPGKWPLKRREIYIKDAKCALFVTATLQSEQNANYRNSRVMPECRWRERLRADQSQTPCAVCSWDHHAIRVACNSYWFPPVSSEHDSTIFNNNFEKNDYFFKQKLNISRRALQQWTSICKTCCSTWFTK